MFTRKKCGLHGRTDARYLEYWNLSCGWENWSCGKFIPRYCSRMQRSSTCIWYSFSRSCTCSLSSVSRTLCESINVHLTTCNQSFAVISEKVSFNCYYLPGVNNIKKCDAEQWSWNILCGLLSSNELIFAFVKKNFQNFFLCCQMSKCYGLIWLLQVYWTLRRRIEKWRRLASSYYGLP